MSICGERVKTFSFRTLNSNNFEEESVNVQIIEKLQTSYSSYIWPSAPVLAYYLWEHREELRGKHILELGAGTALPGLLAAKCGASVTLSESALLPKSVQNLLRSCELNNLTANEVQVIGISWGLFTNSVLKLNPVDLIIGSDCFYEPNIFEDIIATVSYIVDKNSQAKFLTTYQERSSDWSIEHLLNKWNLKCKEICIDDLGIVSGIDLADFTQGHTIHLLEIGRFQ